MRRLLLLAATLGTFAALACGGDSDTPSDTNPTAVPTRAAGGTNPAVAPTRSASPAGANATAPASGGRSANLQLSGSVSGALTLQGMTCGPGTMVSISGTIGAAQYTFEASAAAAGTLQLNSNAGGGIRLVETAPSFRTWAVGALQPGGSGTLTIDTRSGQVNAEVAGIQGNTTTVRIQGSWTCP